MGSGPQWRFIHNTTSALKLFNALLFYILISSLILWTSFGPLCFIQMQVGQLTRLTSFFIDALDDRVRPRSNFCFFHVLVFRSGRFVNKFPDNETERFVTSSRLVYVFLFGLCEREDTVAAVSADDRIEWAIKHFLF